MVEPKKKDSQYVYECKEPVSITAVSIPVIVNEEFETSNFWHKLAHMLWVYYWYKSPITVKLEGYKDFPILGFQFYEFSEGDKLLLKQDWLLVRDFLIVIHRDYRTQEERDEQYPRLSHELRGQLMLIDTAPKFPNNPRFRLKRSFATVIADQCFSNKHFEKLGETINKYVGDFIKREVDNYLHIHTDVAEVIENKIKESERERKAMAGVTKLARERAKKANLHNRKLRDCRIHYCDVKNDRKEESCIFITEGDSASGSITKSRDVNTQAVFSLRGKPLNSFGLTKKVVYENEEFNLLQAALDIEEGLDTLRYNKVIVATDADVDGMHIRLLIITFFLQFFPDLIKKGHVYVLQTPLFRVRNKKTKIKNKKTLAEADAASRTKQGETSDAGLRSSKKSDFITRYCYSEEERLQAIRDLGPDPEITRFKGLGEISPDEFVNFIGPDMRLEQVTLHKNDQVEQLLEYYMGKNTMERQNFIIDNLVIEEDLVEEE